MPRKEQKYKFFDPTPEIPFKQVTIVDDLHDLMVNQWKNTILIKVLGKPWYYIYNVTQ